MLRYTIYAGSDLIYNPRIIGENGEALFKVLEPTLKESTESFSTLTFSALKGSPAYDYTYSYWSCQQHAGENYAPVFTITKTGSKYEAGVKYMDKKSTRAFVLPIVYF